MQIITDLNALPTPTRPCGLTIGTFDGVHLGHHALFHSLRSRITSDGTLIALTFSNHPSDIFSDRSPTPLLTTLEHKLKLLQQEGVDFAIVIPFTKTFAAQPFAHFLTSLQQHLCFTHLTLGTGASFGKNRQGDEQEVRKLAHSLNFIPEYLPKALIDDLPISSGRIRTHLAKAEFAAVQKLLGRPYSIYAPLTQEKTGFKLMTAGLCLPPNGDYPVQFERFGKQISAQALIDHSAGAITLACPQPLHLDLKEQPLVEVIFTSAHVNTLA